MTGAPLRDRAGGAYAPEPRAASQPEALIPSATWLSKVPNTDDTYALVGSDGRDIGFVRRIYETIEKQIPGKQYVAWRRKAKTPSWRWWLKGEYEGGGRYAPSVGTRRRAVERLLADYASAMSARQSQDPQGLGPDRDASAVPATPGDAQTTPEQP